MATQRASIVSHVYCMQILEDQQLLTTERTRRLILRILLEGSLTESESEDAWEKKLTNAMHEQDGEEVNSMLWSMLTSQVRPITPSTGGAYERRSQTRMQCISECRPGRKGKMLSDGKKHCSMLSLHSVIHG